MMLDLRFYFIGDETELENEVNLEMKLYSQ